MNAVKIFFMIVLFIGLVFNAAAIVLYLFMLFVCPESALFILFGLFMSSLFFAFVLHKIAKTM